MSGLPGTIEMLIFDFMKFEVSEQDFPDFLARLPARFCSATVPWLLFQALCHIKVQKERSDGVGRGRVGGIFFFFSRSWERRTASVF